MIKSTKAFLLAGASALAILASAAEANAETFVFTGAAQTFTASVSGEYAVELLGASGGNSGEAAGGLGAEVFGDIFLTKGEDLTLFVGGQGGFGLTSGGGGGGSFVFDGTDVLAVAGGGGGGGIVGGSGGPGLAGTRGETGIGRYGGAGGVDGTGGAGGVLGGGAGVQTGSGGYGGNGAGFEHGYGGKFPNGGAGQGGVLGNGGFGGGGGAGNSGGGGSGFSGGGGGGELHGGGGGGGSYFAPLQFTDRYLKGGVNRGDGSIRIAPVPETSTWAMMLAGFAGLGWFAHARRRKTSPA
jgi:hypothetical protein